MVARFAGETVALAEQSDANRPAGFGKLSGRQEAVTTIASGSAQRDHGTRRPAPLDFARNGAAGVLHQFDS